MCGIGGIVSFDSSEIDQKKSEIIKSSLNHRGPDHSLVRNLSRNCSFIHSRLSIIDLNPRSNQPMSLKDDLYHIVFNGEIYNFKELKKELKIAVMNFNQKVIQKFYLQAIRYLAKRFYTN